MAKAGQSGNPAGCSHSQQDKRTTLRGLLEQHAPALVEKVLALVLAGDAEALRIYPDRLIPSLRAFSLSDTGNFGSGLLSECGDPRHARKGELNG